VAGWVAYEDSAQDAVPDKTARRMDMGRYTVSNSGHSVEEEEVVVEVHAGLGLDEFQALRDVVHADEKQLARCMDLDMGPLVGAHDVMEYTSRSRRGWRRQDSVMDDSIATPAMHRVSSRDMG
jgi:hypothetical protein